jgi:hypothetical protein
VTGEVFYKFLFLGAVEMQKNLIYCLEEKKLCVMIQKEFFYATRAFSTLTTKRFA